MAFPGAKFGTIEDLSIDQWIAILEKRDQVICIHGKLRVIAVVSKENLQQALQEGYATLSLVEIEKVTEQKIRECTESTTKEKAREALDILKEKSVSIVSENPYPTISPISTGQHSSSTEVLVKIDIEFLWNCLTELLNKQAEGMAKPEVYLEMLKEAEKIYASGKNMHSLKQAERLLELLNEALSIVNSKANPFAPTFGLECCANPEERYFSEIQVVLEEMQKYLISVVHPKKFEILLVPKLNKSIEQSKLNRKEKLKWIQNKQGGGAPAIAEIILLDLYLSEFLKNNQGGRECFYICKQKTNIDCKNLNINFSLLELMVDKSIFDPYYLKVAIEFTLNIVTDQCYYFTKLKCFFEKNATIVLQSFISILPNHLQNICKQGIDVQNVVFNLRPIDASLEWHREGKQVYEVEILYREEKFKFICKPRNASIDKSVINIFKEINASSSIEMASLPEYMIIDPHNEPGWNLEDVGEISLWQFIEGKTLEKLNRESASSYIFFLKTTEKYFSSSDEQARVEKLQQKLNRMDAILTQLGISDLHKQNVIVAENVEDVSQTNFFPIDLEVVNRENSTMLGGDLAAYTLTDREKEVVKKFTVLKKPYRVLPASTEFLQQNLGNLKLNLLDLTKTVNNIIQNLQTYYMFEPQAKNILEQGILHDIMHGDIPFLTELDGILYYNLGMDKIELGKRRAQ